jgi:hypothetical protein
MSLLEDAVANLESLGLLDVMLPFLLIFTIAFAVLQKSNILGDSKRPFNKIIAFVLAMASIIPHVMHREPDIVPIINNALPNVSILMIASMMVLLLIGVFGKDVNVAGTPIAGLVVVFSIIAVAYTFLVSAGALSNPPAWLGFLVDEQTRSLLIAILVFGVIIWFITAEEQPHEKRESINDTVNKMFGGVLGGGGHH